MKTILFIHGAYHAGWCWDKVVKLLPKSEFECHTIDLPGNGNNNIGDKKIIDINSYIKYTLDYIKSNKLDNLYVISHSLGGITLSKIIELIPEKINHAFFLTSVILNNDCFLNKFPIEIQEKYKEIATTRDDNSIPPNINRIREILFNSSSDSIELTDFLSKLEPQPIKTYTDIIELNNFKQTTVQTTYVKCKNDISLSKNIMDEFIANIPPSANIIEIDADHEAMFSNPNAVAELFLGKA